MARNDGDANATIGGASKKVETTYEFPFLAHASMEPMGCVVELTDDGAIELWLDGCLRKRRDASDKQPQYVWTNVELEWEEHHYIEARYWADSGELKITVNGDPLLQETLTAH